eukprot:356902-Chlamydomonas_euryale.AAC.7
MARHACVNVLRVLICFCTSVHTFLRFSRSCRDGQSSGLAGSNIRRAWPAGAAVADTASRYMFNDRVSPAISVLAPIRRMPRVP